MKGIIKARPKPKVNNFHICVLACPTQLLIHSNQNLRRAPHPRICPKGCCRCEFLMRTLCRALIQPICQGCWARRAQRAPASGQLAFRHPQHKGLTGLYRQVEKARLQSSSLSEQMSPQGTLPWTQTRGASLKLNTYLSSLLSALSTVPFANVGPFFPGKGK